MADQNAAQSDVDPEKEAKRKKITLIIFVLVVIGAVLAIANGLKKANDLQPQTLEDIKAEKAAGK